MAISKANRSLFPNLPGTSFARYLQQENKKFEHQQGNGTNYEGIFQDVEAQEQEADDPVVIQKAIDAVSAHLDKRIRDITGLPTIYHPMPQLRYKGTLDGRIPQAYPGPAKEGSYWIVAHPGHIGSHMVITGDVLVRLSLANTDWVLVPGTLGPLSNGSFEAKTKEVMGLYQKGFNAPKDVLTKGSPAKPTKTKAAPGPQKRKVILEDE